eukprot:2059036-Rhodomonas_salina.1
MHDGGVHGVERVCMEWKGCACSDLSDEVNQWGFASMGMGVCMNRSLKAWKWESAGLGVRRGTMASRGGINGALDGNGSLHVHGNGSLHIRGNESLRKWEFGRESGTLETRSMASGGALAV